jgi:adenylate cyclase
MQVTFQNQLGKELLFSERRRVVILVIIFSAAIVVRLINQVFLKPDEEALKIESFSTVWLFPLVVILFELLSLAHINQRIRSKKRAIRQVMQYINAGLEICLPSAIMIYVALEYSSYNVLQSPALFIYFIFIILSTLRLNPALSVFCGLLAAVSCASFSLFLYGHFNSNDAARCFILLFSGVSAALVAKQIRIGINNSLEEAERRHKVESLFGQQISAEVAEKLLANDGKIESKRMNVAVMFIDIRNFTQFAAGRSPEEIVQYQNAFLSIVIRNISKHDGIVNQILGDGCMVTFGAPITLANPAQKAVNAAFDILGELQETVASGNIFPTRVGIGIHSGEAVTGNIGTASRQQYSITGSVVIMASRIEQLNKEFHSQLLISEEVFQSINNQSIYWEIYREITLKGFDRPVSIYKVA